MVWLASRSPPEVFRRRAKAGAEGGIGWKGVAQVVDDLGNPLVIPADGGVYHLPLFVALCCCSPHFAGLLNTYLTPERVLLMTEGGGYPQKISFDSVRGEASSHYTTFARR